MGGSLGPRPAALPSPTTVPAKAQPLSPLFLSWIRPLPRLGHGKNDLSFQEWTLYSHVLTLLSGLLQDEPREAAATAGPAAGSGSHGLWPRRPPCWVLPAGDCQGLFPVGAEPRPPVCLCRCWGLVSIPTASAGTGIRRAHITRAHTHSRFQTSTLSHTVTRSPLLRTNSHLQEQCRLNPYLGEIS